MARSVIVNYTGSLVTEECCSCGIMFAMPGDFKAYLLKVGRRKEFYCPNGHPQHYTESIEDKLRQAQNEAASLRAGNDQLAAQNQRLGNDVLDKAKEIRRMKRRTKAGLCQFCRRHFTNVERHVADKHPDAITASTGKA